MTMMLLVFSLLTNTRPVSLADPAEDSAATNTPIKSGADSRRRTGTDDSSFACEGDCSQRTTYPSGRASATTLPGTPSRQHRAELTSGQDAVPGSVAARCLQCNSAAQWEVTG